jgi:hypothetical protein
MPADPAPGDAPGPPTDLVARLHARPHRTVYAFAGAGALALQWLHAVGGSSRTLLEAHDHYHPRSLAEAIGGTPERAVSPEVAAALARRSFGRARHLTEHDERPGPTFGLGLTATIATDRRKRGAHRLEVAVADGLGLRSVGVELAKGARERAGEEALVGRRALALAAEASGLLGVADPAVREDEAVRHGFEPGAPFERFLSGETPVLRLGVDGRPAEGPPAGPPPALVSGSFHPMHDGHRRLAEAAEAHLGRPAWFEMSLGNAEKAEIAAREAWARAAQAYGERGLVLTHEPLFSVKAELMPGVVFVLGVDTARRVLERRFYPGPEGLDRAMERIRAAGARFLVAGRAGPDGFRTLGDLEVPAAFADLFEPLPAFRVDLSSTELRAGWSEATEASVPPGHDAT